MKSEIILRKIEIINRCLIRINQEYEGKKENIINNFTKQDSVILNLQRAIEATLDIASIIIKQKKLGIPKSSRDMFDILCNYGIINKDLANNLKNMVGFRNIAVYDYQNLNIDILLHVLDNNLEDFNIFIKEILK